MKLVHLSAISTGTVIVIGVVLVAPAFFQIPKAPGVTPVMLAFDVLDDSEAATLSAWCSDLSAFLQAQKLKATIFVSGKTAEAAPECVSFSPDIDVGSRTYSYVVLTQVGDYTKALEEIKAGKQAVDRTANIDSRLFRAPDGLTDGDIYSLLNRTGIAADFSYSDHYNVYENGLYVKHEARSLPGLQASANDLGRRAAVPVLIHFDSSGSVAQIEAMIIKLRSDLDPRAFEFVNASGLAGADLTVRGDSHQ
jgi:peptidoglycan/xylan/chitin deacetylase (PgdA/CDA1 family)